MSTVANDIAPNVHLMQPTVFRWHGHRDCHFLQYSRTTTDGARLTAYEDIWLSTAATKQRRRRNESE
jgi:hypothetical protein